LEFRTALKALQEALQIDERRYKTPSKQKTAQTNPGGSVLSVQAANTDNVPLTKPSKVKGKAKAKSKGPKRPMTRKESEQNQCRTHRRKDWRSHKQRKDWSLTTYRFAYPDENPLRS